MGRRSKFVALFCLILLVVGVPPLQALWQLGGVEVCTAVAPQEEPQIASDGEGGAIITWHDFRSTTDDDIYAQRLGPCGETVWKNQGAIICTESDDQRDPQIVSDGLGGAIITWEDKRNGADYDIYAQRINQVGQPQWTENGVPICTRSDDQYNPQLTSDGAGGAIITWEDRYGGGFSIYAQKISAGGLVEWPTDGVTIASLGSGKFTPQICSDGAGGAIIAWEDYRTYTCIYAQRVDADGYVQWTADGEAICTASQESMYPQITSDGAGGAIITWQDFRTYPSTWWDVFAQRIDADGNVQWTDNGIAICALANSQSSPQIASDGAGGAIIVWHDGRDGTSDIYAQRLNAIGSELWTDDGFPVCTSINDQINPQITPDGAGGAIITWQDNRTGTYYDIYAQRLDASSSEFWVDDGKIVCIKDDDQINPQIISDGSEGAIITWQDNRDGNYDIYALQINGDGLKGYLAPEIHSALDVPGDQGGWVNLAWYASIYDPYCNEITEYTIWRALSTPAAALLISEGATLLNSAADIAEAADGPVVRKELLGGLIFFWELIDSHVAYYLDGYSKVVPTVFDSSAVTTNYHYFQIIAHTSDPVVFYISEPDSGYSVDNIPPFAPMSFAGEQVHLPEGLLLTWDPNTEADLANYALYRGLDMDFIPEPGNLLASPSDTMILDGDWRWDSGFFYKLAAVDVHGNESQYALLGPNNVTGDDSPETPLATYLTQNFPNPFNPSTTIHFGLKESANVSLRVYNAAGHLVRVLVQERREAGIYKETWDGHDDGGRAVTSGVYFYSINAGVFRETKKMILLR